MLLNDVNRKDVEEYMNGLIESDQRLSRYKNDFGIQAIINESGYKIDDAVNRVMSAISGYYKPEGETVLLSKLMYEIGYIRFQKPLKVKADLKSGRDMVVDKYARFTDGVDVYLLDESVTLKNGIPLSVEMFLGSRRVITTEINKNTMYFKITLNTTYRKMFDFSVKRGDDDIEYSQAFIKESSDVSLEVKHDGTMEVVVRLNNTRGSNVIQGDILTIELFETTAQDEIPSNMAMIGGADVICENIIKSGTYESYLTHDEMSNILLYNKNINNSLVYNEDFKSLVWAKVSGVESLKIWQQEDEDLENGANTCNINKIFVSHVSTDEYNDKGVEIKEVIESTVYGRYVVLVSPNIVDVGISIDITNNTKKSIAEIKQAEIKSILSGVYDGVEKILTNKFVYKQIVNAIDGNDIDIDLELINKPVLKNAMFYRVLEENISINIVER